MSTSNDLVPEDQGKRVLVRLWQWLDYIFWLPLGTDPIAVLHLQEMRTGRIEWLTSYAIDRRKSMTGLPLVRFMLRDVFVDVPLTAIRVAKQFGIDRHWVYRVFDPVMVFGLLPALFILSGIALGGGPGVVVSAAILLSIWWILMLRLRKSARSRSHDLPSRPTALLTLPNVLTAGRLAFIGLFPVLLYSGHPLRALVLFSALAATDWADGFIARHYNLSSHFGKTLDPVTDRILTLVVVVTILFHGRLLDQELAGRPVGLIVAGAMLAREAVLSVIAVLFLKPESLRRESSGMTHPAGKIGFTVNCLGIVLLLAVPPLPEALRWLALLMLATGTAFNFYALNVYIRGVVDRRAGA